MIAPHRWRNVRLALLACSLAVPLALAQTERITVGERAAEITVTQSSSPRQYHLTTNAPLRDDRPADKQITITERADRPTVRSGSALFDGLYALAVAEAVQNSVEEIRDGGYQDGRPIKLRAFQTGAKWPYVWTRDLAYAVDLALAQFDPPRAADSLLFKTSDAKAGVELGAAPQIIQDTGSGGSYPISTDRVVWTFGARRLLQHLPEPERTRYAKRFYPIMCGTIAQDRRLVFDPRDGLYRGEQSFLDWREQTYPLWTHDNVIAIGMSKALSTNVGHYWLLKTAGELAAQLGHDAEAQRYTEWSRDLMVAINEHFYDKDAGLYAAYLLADVGPEVRVKRYDLLGQSLAILTGVSDLSPGYLGNYPVGPHGPPVVWPQDRSVPIYHNHAIWPFVTAYWTKAARASGNAVAVEHGVRSLMHAAALNLSNMENLDVVTGQAWARVGHLEGPVINSQRQLWSVAGYLSMVQDVIFGQETSWDGIRFRPMVPRALRNTLFKNTDLLELRDLPYCQKRITVRLHLPPANEERHGACDIRRVTLNGEVIGDRFISPAQLKANNVVDIELVDGLDCVNHSLRRLISDFDDLQAHFGPPMPQWQSVGSDGISTDGKLLTLHLHGSDPNATYTIFRNGRTYVTKLRETTWTDPNSGDFADTTYCYAVAAEYPDSGNQSHLTPTRCFVPDENRVFVPAKAMENEGGKLADDHHWMNWGKRDHSLTAKACRVPRDGSYRLRVKFANGSGPVNTGVTCAVKRLQIIAQASGDIVADDYVVMPQSGDWRRWDWSSPLSVDLDAEETYTLRVFEDAFAHNMSYLEHNRRYTANPGGGDDAYNFVDIAGIELVRRGATGGHSR